MKKLLVLALCLVLSGCNIPGSNAVNDTDTNENTLPRTIDISKGISKNGESFSYSFDFDGDEIKEKIEMDLSTSENEWEETLNVSVGEYSVTLDMLYGEIDAVYACDIDSEDGVYDLAIITIEASGDPRLRILKYNSELENYEFASLPNEYGEVGVYDDNWLGYAISYYFNVNDDDTITIEEQTPSYGMWSVYKTYKVDYITLEEIPPERYEILPDFMEKAYLGDMSGEELDMWKKGYIKAYCDYKNDSFEIKTGEYVKPIYDDGKNNIYIEKEDGTGGWMFIGIGENFTREFDPEKFNSHFFYLAG